LPCVKTNPAESPNVNVMDLGTLFDLEPHGPDTFVGSGPTYPWGGLYGGQIVAQALLAASATVEADHSVHSLRAYFIRRGDSAEPVRYEVDRIRNGTSFCTRRVVARQAIGAILNLEASFQRPEPGFELQTVALPTDVPGPDELASSSWATAFDRRWVPDECLSPAAVGTGRVAAWMKVTDPLGDDQLMHRCWLAYLSDDLPTDAVRHALEVHRPSPTTTDAAGADESAQFFAASLDHTVWFHRPMRIDQWHLHDVACHGYVGGRGLAIGHVFALDGTHIATVSQEVLLRSRRSQSSVVIS
jgi:acyl-CoA thioesterase II